MTVLFWGECDLPNGPGNVNRGFQTHLSRNFLRPGHRNRYLRLLQGMGMLCASRVLVVSGVSRQGCILAGLAAILRKKTLFLLHGSALRESRWHPNEKLRRQEAFLMERADLLLTVSRTFRDWIVQIYPQYREKVDFLYPGVDFPPERERTPIAGTVAAAGGDGGIKGNDILARAVRHLPGTRLTVFGPATPGTEQDGLCYTGRLPRERFWQALSRTELFVVNSHFESFSLSALEALHLGCSLLISEHAGAAELLPLWESDVIHDPKDEQELARKIGHLLRHPNNRRLREGLNWEALSWETACKTLEQFCAQLGKGGIAGG